MFAAEFEPAMSNGRRRSPRAGVAAMRVSGAAAWTARCAGDRRVAARRAPPHLFEPAQGLDDLS